MWAIYGPQLDLCGVFLRVQLAVAKTSKPAWWTFSGPNAILMANLRGGMAMSLGERIYKLRTEKELSQGDLAEALEVSRQSISKWETNGSVPELDKLVKLSEVFCVSLDALVTGKEDVEQPAVQEVEPQIVYIEKPVEKRSTAAQKWCISLCSLVCVLLLACLLTKWLPGGQTDGQPTSNPVQQLSENFEATAPDIRRVEIIMDCGDIRITATDTDKIIVAGGKNYTEVSDGLLKIQPNQDGELVITVPKGWNCEDLKINGTALKIDLMDVSIGTLDLSGSACTLNYSGSLENLKVSGTSIAATLRCTNSVSDIKIDGKGCTVDLTLPKDCGFLAQIDSPSCKFDTDLSGLHYYADKYGYGNEYCKIQVKGNHSGIFVTQSN